MMTNNTNNTNTNNINNTYLQEEKIMVTLSVDELNRIHYNPRNKLIKRKIIEKILAKGGITIGDKNSVSSIKRSLWKSIPLNNWQMVFNHKSYCLKDLKTTLDSVMVEKLHEIMVRNEDLPVDGILPFQESSNEQLEYVGDAFLQSIVGYYLYRRFPNQNEGFLSNIRSRIVRNETLSKLTDYLKLNEWLLMSAQAEIVLEGRSKDKTKANIFESFIGTLYNSLSETIYNYKITETFVINIIENALDITEFIQHDNNYIHQLMQLYQKNYGGITPEYDTLNEDGTINKKIFTMCVYDPNGRVGGKVIGVGKGGSKKEGKQNAAKIALECMLTLHSK